jgi:subtilisin family serine protease
VTILSFLDAPIRAFRNLPRAVPSLIAAMALIPAGLPVLAPAVAAERSPEVLRPRRDSLEYRLSLGLPAIRANGAYARGATGNGVTVAMIDTGVGNSASMFAQLSSASTDLVGTRQAADVNVEHGEQTATLLGGALDGTGIVGVAYGATLMSIRADIDGSCAQRCAVRGTDLARGIDYAIAHGARIIGVPLVGTHRLPTVEPALARAAAAGAVIVIAAGNDGGAEPTWPARYASDPRLARAIIVAGASTRRGGLASWSSKAAAAADRYVIAPGEDLPVDCGTKFCNLASGTSYSVPFVAGALSLVMSRYPSLEPQEAADILLQSARPLSQESKASVTGRGMLDVTRAMRMAARAVESRGRDLG